MNRHSVLTRLTVSYVLVTTMTSLIGAVIVVSLSAFGLVEVEVAPYSWLAFGLLVALLMGVLSLPVALLAAWWIVRPMARRLRGIATVGKAFATGAFDQRVNDGGKDEIAQLAHDFDSMADALQQNLNILQELARQNADLIRASEQAAIHAERLRLARDMHDAIAQRLFSLTAGASTLAALIPNNTAKSIENARFLARVAEDALLDLRTLLLDLRPAALDRQDFVTALKAWCDQWQQLHGTDVQIDTPPFVPLPAQVEADLFYVVREALNNVAKHASATKVAIGLQVVDDTLTVEIGDEGRGFDPDNATSGVGLTSIRERIAKLGGSVSIQSQIGIGTTLRIVIETST